MTKPGLRHHHTLQSLRVHSYHGDYKGFEDYVFLPFLTTCSTNLKDLGAPRIEYLYTPNIYKARAQLGIYIEEISSYTYPHMCHSTDETLAYAIVHSPRLRRMDLRGCYNASSLTAAAIQSDCEHLEELDLDRCQLPVMEDWASKSLVKFVFMIWVPRLDADVSWIGRREEFAGPTVEHSHNVQRQVYRLLARQTKLEVLDLGHRWSDNDWTVSYPFYQYYSLEMSIESGLEELGVLKEIRELDLRLINHKITVRELEWMVEHWPKLRTVKGLVQEKRSGQNAVLRAWCHENRPSWAQEQNVAINCCCFFHKETRIPTTQQPKGLLLESVVVVQCAWRQIWIGVFAWGQLCITVRFFEGAA